MEPLTVPGDLGSLGAIRDFVRAASAAAGLDKTATYKLSLAVDEIASNIVMHGYEEAGKTGGITISCDVSERALSIHLEDTGASYDAAPFEAPESLKQPFGERKEGGLGVYLAMQGVDDFKYVTEGGRNRHTFVVNRQG